MEEDFASIMDSVPPPRTSEKYQAKNVRYLFAKGIAIGILMAMSFGGICQYFIMDLEENELLRLLVKKFWYGVGLWTWIFCLFFFGVLAIHILRKIGKYENDR